MKGGGKVNNSLFVNLLIISVLAYGTGTLFMKKVCKNCFVNNKSWIIILSIIFVGIHFAVFIEFVLFKIWLVLNLVAMMILYYYKKVIEKELFFKNSFKILKSEKKKKFIIVGLMVYIIFSFLINYYTTLIYIPKENINYKFIILIDVFSMFLVEAINIFCFASLISYYYLPKVIIWGENLTKYEGWLIEESEKNYLLKEKFSGKIITIKKDVINQIVIVGEGI
ncbi:hypothetical protein [Caldicellulosiruptor morganii]|uniref:hypothetical protein n=1 Tax=Caldicellulosiruptor morganii TaxID=1387555 RepID=UPI0018E2F66A|nr:hypothetical protein [Caldicellulosiruptor morganii]